MHGDGKNGMFHRTSAFPLHHKAYLWMYESALIYTALKDKVILGITEEEACSITLPYWEWDKFYTKPEPGMPGNWDKIVQSDVFQGEAVFGNPPPAFGVPASGYVTTGYFSNATGYGNITMYDGDRKLKRDFLVKDAQGRSFFDFNFNIVTQIGDRRNFSTFIDTIHANLHGFVHNWVGGWMAGTGNAGYDPLFYLHHCNNDRFWHMWVDCRGWEFTDENALTDVQYLAKNPLNPNSPPATNKTKEPFLVGLDDRVNFYTDGVLTTFLPYHQWPKIREMWSTGTASKRGWNGLYYRYGYDTVVASGVLNSRCSDLTWSLVNQT
jgi:hypothetical protein